jgi:hypothetical protein
MLFQPLACFKFPAKNLRKHRRTSVNATHPAALACHLGHRSVQRFSLIQPWRAFVAKALFLLLLAFGESAQKQIITASGNSH